MVHVHIERQPRRGRAAAAVATLLLLLLVITWIPHVVGMTEQCSVCPSTPVCETACAQNEVCVFTGSHTCETCTSSACVVIVDPSLSAVVRLPTSMTPDTAIPISQTAVLPVLLQPTATVPTRRPTSIPLPILPPIIPTVTAAPTASADASRKVFKEEKNGGSTPTGIIAGSVVAVAVVGFGALAFVRRGKSAVRPTLRSFWSNRTKRLRQTLFPPSNASILRVPLPDRGHPEPFHSLTVDPEYVPLVATSLFNSSSAHRLSATSSELSTAIIQISPKSSSFTSPLQPTPPPSSYDPMRRLSVISHQRVPVAPVLGSTKTGSRIFPHPLILSIAGDADSIPTFPNIQHDTSTVPRQIRAVRFRSQDSVIPARPRSASQSSCDSVSSDGSSTASSVVSSVSSSSSLEVPSLAFANMSWTYPGAGQIPSPMPTLQSSAKVSNSGLESPSLGPQLPATDTWTGRKGRGHIRSHSVRMSQRDVNVVIGSGDKMLASGVGSGPYPAVLGQGWSMTRDLTVDAAHTRPPPLALHSGIDP
ncbi:uncharacterized protein SPPG_04436 [Spizellomyces punctatus DAOM BR117]|uniref:Membrane anchor Opy2 N-terminal domain-containing protein n=1 Tax=Spizellomyces punctatus (strain DAOM BR117) TaxID=645134 RepID=A0A0L0HGV9_SPIPD|nr:uncharacterized protein SPPG_04436 [Spizellomyces punctatus DAOM BR117]KND00095.1 hypothetical protein SPPG_04436 [Spizellomyces punctatus DAOM BR117]|eukprot:XP_016608134.1 hypothetical protein SPPG_04436 [Spizellomyces punctatus DAOM BR117]